MLDGNDYQTTAPQVFTFDSSKTTFTFDVQIIDDNITEGNEILLAGLRFLGGKPVPRVTLDPAEANITILDDDSKKNYVA